MTTHVAALWRAFRSPSVQDAGLAALLLTATWAVGGPGAASDASFLGAWARPAWWLATLVCVAAVALRRRWPVLTCAAALLAAGVQMALGSGPAPADLAVLVTLYTVAVRRPRWTSVAVLAAAVAAVAAWSMLVAAGDGAGDWLTGGPSGTGGQTLGAPGESASSGETAFRPVDWGGILVLGPLLVVAWAVGWGVRSRRAYVGELEARAREAERERDRRAEDAVAAERARLTREMHDVVAHGLAVIVMQAQGGAAAFERRPADTRAALDTIVATGRTSLAEMRHVLATSGELADTAASAPGLAELARLVDRVRASGTPVLLEVDGAARPLPAAVDVAAYRILQESLTNTMRHAGAGAAARVVVRFERHHLTLEVSDDGAGGTAGGASPGNGLRGMRERAALLDGELSAGPGADGGFLVRARLPLDAGEAA